MANRKRYILEGEWTGYRSGQQRVVHRVVTTRPEKYAGLHYISYADGTGLVLTVRPCNPREKVEEIHGYDSLIADCVFYKVDRVDQIEPARERLRAEAKAALGPCGCKTQEPMCDPVVKIEKVEGVTA